MTRRDRLLPASRVIVAPMAGGPSSTSLIVAASEAGALAYVAGGNQTTDALAAQIADVRSHERIFAVNLFMPTLLDVDDAQLAAYVSRIAPIAADLGTSVGQPRGHDDHWSEKQELVLAMRPPIVSLTFGLPEQRLVDALHERDIAVVVGVSDVEQAREATAACVDGLVVQSAQAGGHSTTWHPDSIDTGTTTPQLVAAVRAALGTDAPVLHAAGGITTRSAADAAIRAGADAVQAGTAFLLADEATVRAPHRAALLAGSAETIMTRSFTGRPARMLVNAFTDAADAVAPLAYPHLQSATDGIRRASNDRDSAEWLNCYAGAAYREAVPGTAAEIVERLRPSSTV